MEGLFDDGNNISLSPSLSLSVSLSLSLCLSLSLSRTYSLKKGQLERDYAQVSISLAPTHVVQL